MMILIKRFWVVIVFAFCLIVFLISKYNSFQEGKHKKAEITTKSFQTENGWGYDVLINDTVLIHQDVVPGAPGNNGFKTEAQALLVGKLVVDKMNKSKNIPAVRPRELDSLGIK